MGRDERYAKSGVHDEDEGHAGRWTLRLGHAILRGHVRPMLQDLQANISYHYYQSGHNVYVNGDVLKHLDADVAAFIRETEGGKSAGFARMGVCG